MLRTLAAGLLATTSLALTAVPAFEAASPVGSAQALCTPRGTACTDLACDDDALHVPPAWCSGGVNVD